MWGGDRLRAPISRQMVEWSSSWSGERMVKGEERQKYGEGCGSAKTDQMLRQVNM